MKAKEFLSGCAAYLVNSQFCSEGISAGNLPRVYGEYKGHHVKFDFVVSDFLIIEVLEQPGCEFDITRHTFLTRIMAAIFGGYRTIDPGFSHEFMMLNVDRESAGKIFTVDNIGLLCSFKPFETLKFTKRDYKVKKLIDTHYTPESARLDLERLISLNATLSACLS